MTQKPYSKGSKLTIEKSIRAAVFELLDKNPLLSARNICRILELDYNYYKRYVWKLKSVWKTLPRNEHGSKCSKHGWRGWTYLPDEIRADQKWHGALRLKAVHNGWIQSKSRNRFLLFKDRVYGRLEWFETGRVNLQVRSPANRGRALQLLCLGFSHTGLITDLKLLVPMLEAVRFKSAHYIFGTDERLPQLTIDLFRKSNGITIKVGDRSHPHAVEVIAEYPDWAEQNERLFQNVMELLREAVARRPDRPDRSDRYVS